MDNLIGHLIRNELMWREWEKRGVRAGTVLTVDFHFNETGEEGKKRLSKAFTDRDIPFQVLETRKWFVLKAWLLEANVTQPWTLDQLQEKTREMAAIGEQAGVELVGCGAMMPG